MVVHRYLTKMMESLLTKKYKNNTHWFAKTNVFCLLDPWTECTHVLVLNATVPHVIKTITATSDKTPVGR